MTPEASPTPDSDYVLVPLVDVLRDELMRQAPTAPWDHGCIDLDDLARVIEARWTQQRLDYERRIVAAECGTQAILNDLVGKVRWFALQARTNRDASDGKAAEVLENIAKIIDDIDVVANTDAARPTPGPCEACGGNGYSGGKMPSDPDMRGEYDVACEVCCGRGVARPTPADDAERREGAECPIHGNPGQYIGMCCLRADRSRQIGHASGCVKINCRGCGSDFFSTDYSRRFQPRDTDARLREALEAALPRLAHRHECWSCRPASEWAEHGSASFDNCSCEISLVRVALEAERGSADV